MSVLTTNKAVNIVVKRLFLLFLLVNILASLTNVTFITLLWVQFDWNLLRDGLKGLLRLKKPSVTL